MARARASAGIRASCAGPRDNHRYHITHRLHTSASWRQRRACPNYRSYLASLTGRRRANCRAAAAAACAFGDAMPQLYALCAIAASPAPWRGHYKTFRCCCASACIPAGRCSFCKTPQRASDLVVAGLRRRPHLPPPYARAWRMALTLRSLHINIFRAHCGDKG